MEQPQYLIDTNAVIDYFGKKMPLTGMLLMNDTFDAIPVVSVITKIEILGFNAPAEHYQLLTNFMYDATILDLTSEIVDISIEIRKKYKTKLPDAIIAASAIAYGMTLISRNTNDFKSISGLRVVDPHTL